MMTLEKLLPRRIFRRGYPYVDPELFPPSFRTYRSLSKEQIEVKATVGKGSRYCPRCNTVMPKDVFGDARTSPYCVRCACIYDRWRAALRVRAVRLRLLNSGIIPQSLRASRPTPKQRFDILERDGYACRYCGRRAPEYEIIVEHVVPVALGGLSEPDNLVAACAECNDGKGTRLLATPVQPIPRAEWALM